MPFPKGQFCALAAVQVAHWTGHAHRPPAAWFVAQPGQGMRKLAVALAVASAAGEQARFGTRKDPCHAELPVHVLQVVLDGAGAEEQLRGDVTVGVPSLASPAAGARARRHLGEGARRFPARTPGRSGPAAPRVHPGLGGSLAGAFAGASSPARVRSAKCRRPSRRTWRARRAGARVPRGGAYGAAVRRALHEPGQLGVPPGTLQVPDGLPVKRLRVVVADEQSPGWEQPSAAGPAAAVPGTLKVRGRR